MFRAVNGRLSPECREFCEGLDVRGKCPKAKGARNNRDILRITTPPTPSGYNPMPRNYKMHVWEVQQAAQAILDFTSGKTLQDYATDQILRSAVERQINKIGGALASLIVHDDPTARRIGGYGGTLGWGRTLEPYDIVEEREVWDFVQDKLPAVLDDATAVLEQEPDDQPAHAKPQQRKIIPLVANRKQQIRTLCRRHHVKRLDVFGSAVNGDFNPDESDIDFLVQFDDAPPKPWYGNHIDLKEDLESLSNRTVDLIDDTAIKNPYFRKSVDETREQIYAARP